MPSDIRQQRVVNFGPDGLPRRRGRPPKLRLNGNVPNPTPADRHLMMNTTGLEDFY